MKPGGVRCGLADANVRPRSEFPEHLVGETLHRPQLCSGTFRSRSTEIGSTRLAPAVISWSGLRVMVGSSGQPEASGDPLGRGGRDFITHHKQWLSRRSTIRSDASTWSSQSTVRLTPCVMEWEMGRRAPSADWCRAPSRRCGCSSGRSSGARGPSPTARPHRLHSLLPCAVGPARERIGRTPFVSRINSALSQMVVGHDNRGGRCDSRIGRPPRCIGLRGRAYSWRAASEDLA